MAEPTLSELAHRLMVIIDLEDPAINEAAAALRAADEEIAILKRDWIHATSIAASECARADRAEAALADWRNIFNEMLAMEGAEGITDAKFVGFTIALASAALARHLPANSAL